MKDSWQEKFKLWVKQKHFIYAPYLVPKSQKSTPDFLIIGAQKSGTTALLRNLEQHPDIFMAQDPIITEVKFFSRESRWKRGKHWYMGNFPHKQLYQGEKDPACLFHFKCHERIKKTVPDAKLIILLRNPVDRAYSQWNHYNQQYKMFNKLGGWEKVSFEEALQNTDELVKRGEYMDQITHLMKFFPREQVYIGIAERFKKHPSMEVKKVLSFLEIPYADIDLRDWHTRSYPALMKEETRQHLNLHFKPLNERLFSFLGDFVPEWEES